MDVWNSETRYDLDDTVWNSIVNRDKGGYLKEN